MPAPTTSTRCARGTAFFVYVKYCDVRIRPTSLACTRYARAGRRLNNVVSTNCFCVVPQAGTLRGIRDPSWRGCGDSQSAFASNCVELDAVCSILGGLTTRMYFAAQSGATDKGR